MILCFVPCARVNAFFCHTCVVGAHGADLKKAGRGEIAFLA